MKLIDYPYTSIKRGVILRLPSTWPYEAWVDFMVVDLFDSHALVITTGHKAGLVLVTLPAISSSSEGRALSTVWMKKNWEEWIYPECKVEDVHIIENYDSVEVF